MLPQSVVDLVEICSQKGVNDAVISPGSRNAPLTIAFARHSKINSISIPDERTAAFVALGMALKSKRTVVLICTSGSAALNYAPAVSEAFFSQIPLLILTADRPPEWIDQLDGQTIYQQSVFGQHIKKSFDFPAQEQHKDAEWFGHRMVNEALNLTQRHPIGPVHINLPFREPFYPKIGDKLSVAPDIKIINESHFVSSISKEALSDLSKYRKILIVGGQWRLNTDHVKLLEKVSDKLRIPVATDIISNLHPISNAIKHHDLFLRTEVIQKELKPDLVISFGMSVISKNLKLFLRNSDKTEHWHIQISGNVADTFQKLTRIIRCDPQEFFRALNTIENVTGDNDYYQKWQNRDLTTWNILESAIHSSDDFSEFQAFKYLFKSLPDSIDIHLANSMAVRYANFIGISDDKTEVLCNRGTSGIDGSVSTALGAALKTDRTVVLITGDMAFFYDRNAFWLNHIPENLKIIVLNNHGGGIFRLISGPGSQPELEEYFETRQPLSAKSLAEEHRLKYWHCQDLVGLKDQYSEFIQYEGSASILEIDTVPENNKRIYDHVLSSIEQNLK